ncbi:MAG: hypothetical protein RLZZ383_2225, partial [Pseudomonadota bacterium]
ADPTAIEDHLLDALGDLHVRACLDATDDAKLLAGLEAVARRADAWHEVVVRLDVASGALVTPGHSSPARWRHALALARLALDQRVTPDVGRLPLEAAQAALVGGADGLGPVAPADAAQAERLIRSAGLRPFPRDALGAAQGPAWTAAKKIRPVHERLGGAPSA